MIEPYWTDGTVRLHLGKVENVLPTLPDASVDAVVTDPPYNLPGGFMGRDWDRFEHGRAFQAWCEVWAAECLRILKPGGFLLAFGGTRTWHRMVCAIEDAGFEIRDGIADLTGQDAPGLMWTYGSGFPKSLDVGKAIDKRPGVALHRAFAVHLAERREAAGLSRSDVALAVVGSRTGACWNWEHHQFPEARWWPALRALLDLDEKWGHVIAEADREVIGQRTTGIGTGRGSVTVIGDSGNRDVTAPATEDATRWEGWGTALKPAWEPIAVARKPLSGTVAANVLAHGTGALNIDACRTEAMGRPLRTAEFNGYDGDTYGTGRSVGLATGTTDKGRWPTNVVMSHQPLVNDAGEAIGDACTDGCAPGCPVAELDQQSGVLKSGANPTRRNSDKFRNAYGDFAGQEECTPARGADEGGASRFFPVFRYEAKAPTSERPKVDGVAHETVKPLALMRWLVRLVTQPGGTVLDPFLGSGTTAEACAIEGFQCIGIERDEKYIPLIKARLGKPLQAVLGFEEPA